MINKEKNDKKLTSYVMISLHKKRKDTIKYNIEIKILKVGKCLEKGME